MRLALGCMRLSTDRDRDDERAQATLRAALDAGFSVLDTAHAYGLDTSDLGHNERLVARALRSAVARGDDGEVRVVTAERPAQSCGASTSGCATAPRAWSSTTPT